MTKTQEYSVRIDDKEAKVVIKSSGWWRWKKIKVEYFMPKNLQRTAYSLPEKHVSQKLKRRPFIFHIHFHWKAGGSY